MKDEDQNCWVSLLALFVTCLKTYSGILILDIRITTRKETGQNMAKAAPAEVKGTHRARKLCLRFGNTPG